MSEIKKLDKVSNMNILRLLRKCIAVATLFVLWQLQESGYHQAGFYLTTFM
jgi:hypothetical protein